MKQYQPGNIRLLDSPPPLEFEDKKIVMFGTPSCPDCLRIKKFFTDSAIEYEYHDLTREKKYLDWVSSLSNQIPVLIMPNGDLLYSPSNFELRQNLNHQTTIAPESSDSGLFDVIVVGGGPSGITAAIYAVRKNLKVLLITKTIGGQAVYTEDIENYPGFTLITGEELAVKFKAELDKFKGEGLWLKEGSEVISITGKVGDFKLKTESSEYNSKIIIIASGRVPKKLGIPGEDRLFGKGVATCATCDAPFYKGKDVIVVGGGNSALESAHTLIKVANSVKLIALEESPTIDEVLKSKLRKSPKFEMISRSTVTEIKGEMHVEGVTVKNVDTNQLKELSCEGVFIEIGWIPKTEFISQVDRDEFGRIKVNQACQTSITGIWAAGDVNDLSGEQIVIAAGEGAKAALSASEFLSTQTF